MRALIVGVDGHIGACLSHALLEAGWEVIGTTRRNTSNGPGHRIPLDLAGSDLDATPLPDVDVAFICAAMARFADCRERPDMTRRVNVIAPMILGRRLIDAGARVILLSSSAVFDGSSPFVPADHVPCPLSPYGMQKAEAEAAVLALGSEAMVFRLTKVLTPDLPLLLGWIDRLRHGRVVHAFSDLTIAPLTARHVVSGLISVAMATQGGIYQVSGAEDISYTRIARGIAERIGVAPTLVHATFAIEAGLPPSDVLPHTSLDVSRMTALCGWRAPDYETVLSEVYDLGQTIRGAAGI